MGRCLFGDGDLMYDLFGVCSLELARELRPILLAGDRTGLGVLLGDLGRDLCGDLLGDRCSNGVVFRVGILCR